MGGERQQGSTFELIRRARNSAASSLVLDEEPVLGTGTLGHGVWHEAVDEYSRHASEQFACLRLVGSGADFSACRRNEIVFSVVPNFRLNLSNPS